MNIWFTCFRIGVGVLAAVLAAGFVLSHRKNPKGTVHFRYYFFAGVLLSAAVLMVPFSTNAILKLKGIGDTCLHIAVSSVNYVMQMFWLNAPHEVLLGIPENLEPAWLPHAYSWLISAEFLIAPLLTFTIVAMFFRNLTASISFFFQFFRHVHVFSDLNEESLALAGSIKRAHRWTNCIVFTNVSEELEQSSNRLIKEARDLRAICFRKDILGPNFMLHLPLTWLKFYTISEDETANIVNAAELMEKYARKRKSYLYVFTSRPECEYLLNKKTGEKKEKDRLVTRRINAVASLINRTLYEDGCRLLYDEAEEGTPRKISVVLVGLGLHGMEMLKALVWYCQMYGYKLEINAFDKNSDILKQFSTACAELLEQQDRERGGRDDPSEPGYDIHIHPDTKTESGGFAAALRKIDDPAYVLVALGNDEDNIRNAVNIRMHFERIREEKKLPELKPRRPKIQAIVYNSKECRILEGISNAKNQTYDIDFIGDVESSYTEKTLINLDLENDAKEIHMEYADADTLLDYEYNFRSSCASAIHARAVARHMTDLTIREDLLEKVEFWIRLAYKLANPKAAEKLTVGETAREQMFRWARETREYLEDFVSFRGFSFDGWNRSSVADDKQLSGKTGALEKIQKAYDSFMKAFRDGGAEQAADTGLGRPFTRQAFRDYDLKIRTDDAHSGYEPREVVRYCLLTMKLMVLEHERWCAYMRANGYRKTEGERNDLGKMHDDLVPFSKLKDKEKGKDLHMKLLLRHRKQLREQREKEAGQAVS